MYMFNIFDYESETWSLVDDSILSEDLQSKKARRVREPNKVFKAGTMREEAEISAQ
jgi:hypothetical protein